MQNINSQTTSKWTTVNDSEFEHCRFQWHDDTQLLMPKNSTNNAVKTQNSQTDHIEGVMYINDADCFKTLESIKRVVKNKDNFCVYNDSLRNIANLQQQQSQTQPQSQAVKNTTSKSTNKSAAYLHCMSSGSTGKAKRICRSHASWIKSFLVTRKNAELTSADSYAIIGKLSHSLTLYGALEAAWIGADIHAIAELRPDKQYAAMHALGSSVIYATPTQLRMLCSGNKLADNSNKTLRHIFCGGGKLDQETLSFIQHCFPQASVKEFYGASETSFITISDANTPIESVGRAYPGVEIKIEPVTELTGEVWVKSPYLFEYYSEGQETDTQWQESFLSVGELGHLDADGYLYLTGRRSRMVSIADNMVFPEQIEKLINQHEAVNHSAIISLPDETRGTMLIAMVETVSDDDNKEALRSALLNICRRELGNLKSPRKLIFIKQLPLLPSGKVDLQILTQHYQAL